MEFIKDALSQILGQYQVYYDAESIPIRMYDIEYICSFIILCLFLIAVFKILGWVVKSLDK